MSASSTPLRRTAVRLLAGLFAVALLMTGQTAVAHAAEERYPAPADGAWTVDGRGWGHGIGLSQWGAQGAALQGRTADQILGFYYPGTTSGSVANDTVEVALSALVPTSTVTLWAPAGQQAFTVSVDDGASRQVGGGRLTITRNGTTEYVVERRTSPTGGVIERLTLKGTQLRVATGDGVVVARTSSATTGTWYRGTIRLAPSTAAGSFDVVNDVLLEDYLRGVVPRESPASWELEALRAQAVAARSYVLSEGRRSTYFETCDTTQCQVYGGRATVDAAGKVTANKEHARTDEAVRTTAGTVRKYGSAVAFTQFSATNGGYGRTGSKPYLAAQADPYTGTAPGDTRTRWTSELRVDTVARQCPSGGKLNTLVVVSRDGNGDLGGRITKLRLECTTGSRELTGTSAMAFGMYSHWWKPQPEPVTTQVERLSGADRYAVSAATSRANFAPGVAVAYIANGLTSVDALSAAPVAGKNDAPVLLTQAGSLPTAVAAELERLQPQRIVILGGAGAVSSAVQQHLDRYTAGPVVRWSGADRYAVSAAVSRASFSPGVDVAYVANGLTSVDALSAAPVAGMHGAPVLVTQAGALPTAVAAELDRLNPRKIVILGGTGAVSSTVQSQLGRYAPSVGRWSGPDRYAVSAAVSRATFDAGAPVVYVANGLTSIDALSAAPVAGMRGAPVLLTQQGALPTAVLAELERLRPGKVVILGGTGAVSTAVQEQLARM
ncbi:cell wall-binding repeat-containing protein [Georgenia daeguensis]|uniref:Sporulation stage II protein D amidase enhancer LytB N-terminal domain-containing protein n=1 Tax=Georgenia daeguensis TaxID=908355 RepID=A0ABP8EXC3_9MICO